MAGPDDPGVIMLGSLDNAYPATAAKGAPDDSSIAAAMRRPQPGLPEDQAPLVPVTIVIVEDHLLVADGLRTILNSIPELTVLEVARTCAEGVLAVARHHPDILLLDQWLPDGLGVDQIPALLQICDSMKVLVVTAQDSDALVVQAIAAGAVGVIVKTKRATVLVAAIRAAARGDAVVTPDVLNQIVRRLTSADLPRGRIDHHG